MAKKKKDVESDDAPTIIDYSQLLIDEISKEMGDGIISSPQSILDLPRTTISVSPALDFALGGGITSGSWGVFTGKPKTGKTTTALHFAANAQAAGFVVYYIDAEGRLKERDLKGIPNLRMDMFFRVGSTEDNILSAEQYTAIIDRIVKSHRRILVIVDSFSILQEQAKQLEFGKQTRGGQAKVVADLCGSLANVVPLKDSIIIGITHQYSNTSGRGPSTIEKTPNSLFYQTDFKLKVDYIQPWKVGGTEDGEQIGQHVFWQCLCSGLRGPGRKVESMIRYGHGIDEVAEIIAFATEVGVIKKAASWLSYTPKDGEPIKLQGAEKFGEYLKENPDVKNMIWAEVKELIV